MICLRITPISISKQVRNLLPPTRPYQFDAKRSFRSKKLTLGPRFESDASISCREVRLMEASASSSSSSSLMLTSGASGRVNAIFSPRAWKILVRLISAVVLLCNGVVLLLTVPFRGRKRSALSSPEKLPKDEKQRRKKSIVMVPVPIVAWKSQNMRPSTAPVDDEVAVRRALAIQRVIEDKDENSVREFSLCSTARGDTLFTQSWTPIKGMIRCRGVVVLLHGLNEHSGRYSDFAKQLNANGYKVYGMDWIGHGGTDGLHAYVSSLDDAVEDLKLFLEKVLVRNPALPCFCFGHSTGGAIVLKAMLDRNLESRISGVILTSPAVGVQPSHPIFVVLAPIFSFLLPRYQFGAANKKGTRVSRDPEALVAKYSDPLVYTGYIRVRTGYEILKIAAYLQHNFSKLKIPFFVLHGTADTVTDPEASRKLYEKASSADKTIKLLEGFLHDLLFEPEREDIVRDIIEWLNRRV